MENMKRLDEVAQDLRKARNFVNNGEKVFKGEEREAKAGELLNILDNFGIKYKVSEFKTFVIVETISDELEDSGDVSGQTFDSNC